MTQPIPRLAKATPACGARRTSWTVRSPNGLEVNTVKLPQHVVCGVCCEPMPLDGATGRIACSTCHAHVVTVLVRSSPNA